jgi:hypothetical protein
MPLKSDRISRFGKCHVTCNKHFPFLKQTSLEMSTNAGRNSRAQTARAGRHTRASQNPLMP